MKEGESEGAKAKVKQRTKKRNRNEFQTIAPHMNDTNSIINRTAYNNTRDIFSIHHHVNGVKFTRCFNMNMANYV